MMDFLLPLLAVAGLAIACQPLPYATDIVASDRIGGGVMTYVAACIWRTEQFGLLELTLIASACLLIVNDPAPQQGG